MSRSTSPTTMGPIQGSEPSLSSTTTASIHYSQRRLFTEKDIPIQDADLPTLAPSYDNSQAKLLPSAVVVAPDDGDGQYPSRFKFALIVLGLCLAIFLVALVIYLAHQPLWNLPFTFCSSVLSQIFIPFLFSDEKLPSS